MNKNRHLILVLIIVALGALTFLASSKPITAAWYNTGWQYRKPITIPASSMSGVVTNFPMVVKLGNDIQLAAKALASGNDILFTSADGSTKLAHELVSFTKATGALIAWVKVPQLTNASATTIYMYYGNAASGVQQNPTATWNNGFKGVYHMDEASGAVLDKSGNNFNGTPTGTTAVAGIIGNARDLDGIDDVIEYPITQANVDFSTNYTLSTWINLDRFGDPTSNCTVKSSGIFAKEGGYYGLIVYSHPTAKQLFTRHHDTTNVGYGTGTAAFSEGTWQLITLVHDNVANQIRVYRNGVLENNVSTGTATLINPSGYFYTGDHLNNCGNDFTDGRFDETRVANTNRSAAWIKAEHDNQKSPTTFYSLGSEELSTPSTPTNTPIPTNTPTPIPPTPTPTGVPQGPSICGTGLFFDDVQNQYVEIANESAYDFATGDSITLEAWVYPTDIFANRPGISANRDDIVVKGQDEGNRNFELAIGGTAEGVGEAWFGYRTSISEVFHVYDTVNANLTNNNWYHIVFTYTYGMPSSARMYVNGQLKSGIWSSGNGATAPLPNNYAVRIGAANLSGLNERFDGIIDEVRIYRGILSAGDIANHYNGGSGLYQDKFALTNLIGGWHLEEGSGSTAYDFACAGGADNGTLVNNPMWVAGLIDPPSCPPPTPSGYCSAPSPTPTSIPTPTPTTVPAQIIAQTYIDLNENCSFDGGDSLAGEMDLGRQQIAPLSCENQETITTSTGAHTFSNLTCFDGTSQAIHQISFLFPDPAYSFRCDNRTNNLLQKSVTIGINSTTTVSAALSKIRAPWLQVIGSDLFVNGAITNPIPATAEKPIMLGNGAHPAGNLTATGIDIGEGQVSESNWSIVPYTGDILFDHNEAKRLIGDKTDVTITAEIIDPPSVGMDANGDGIIIYHVVNPATIDGNWTNLAVPTAIIADGPIIINTPITLANNGFLILQSDTTISVANHIGTVPSDATSFQLEGLFVAGTNFNAGGTGDANLDKRLNIHGSVITATKAAGAYLSVRTHLENFRYPSDYLVYDPKLLLNFPPSLLKPSFTWGEIQN